MTCTFTNTVQQIDYVAMGDSYSSGTGAGSYDAGNDCFRSSLAYPRIIASRHLEIAIHPVACNGAVINDVLNAGELPAQIDSLDEGIELVSITIGGNDIGFAEIGITCAMRSNCPRFFRGLVPSIRNLRLRLADLYSRLLQTSEDARIYVVAYPLVVPHPRTVSEGCSGISLNEMTFLRDVQILLNRSISAAVEQAAVIAPDRINYIDVADSFLGHEICTGFDVRWVNLFDPLNITESFHPNAAGHLQLADDVETAMGLDE